MTFHSINAHKLIFIINYSDKLWYTNLFLMRCTLFLHSCLAKSEVKRAEQFFFFCTMHFMRNDEWNGMGWVKQYGEKLIRKKHLLYNTLSLIRGQDARSKKCGEGVLPPLFCTPCAPSLHPGVHEWNGALTFLCIEDAQHTPAVLQSNLRLA